MLLHDARRESREDEAGEIVLLEDQDRNRWNRAQIAEPLPLVAEARRGKPGPYALQAAIAAEHCKTAGVEETNWHEVVRLYEELERIHASPVITLNREAAVAMTEGPNAALAIIDTLSGDLENYHLLHAARADLLRRIGAREQAATSYACAIEMAGNERERIYLECRLKEVQESLASKVTRPF